MMNVSVTIQRFAALHDLMEEIYYPGREAPRYRAWKKASKMLNLLQDEIVAHLEEENVKEALDTSTEGG